MIHLYWWEGFCGYKNLFSRIVNGLPPYVYNFGDQLSPFIIHKLSGKEIKHTTKEGKLLALGSIFFSLKNNDIVWGAGLLNASHIQYAKQSKHVTYLAVRGPKTRDYLMQHGIDCPAVYGDPALLLPLLVKNDVKKKFRVGIVPHFSHFNFFKSLIKNRDSVTLIDVERPFHQVVYDILSCEIILSSSLHGIIVAEAYSIPSFMLMVGEPLHGDLFKFEDYYHATDRTLTLSNVLFGFNLDKLASLAQKNERPKFSCNELLNAFPFKTTRELFDSNIGWTELLTSAIKFKSSLLPPLGFLPKKV